MSDDDFENFFLPDPRRPRADAVANDATATSRDAANEASYLAGSECYAVLRALFEAGNDGLTAAEATKYLTCSRNQTAARMWQLRKDKVAKWKVDEEDTPVTRTTDDGRGRYRGRVHIITPLGIQAMLHTLETP